MLRAKDQVGERAGAAAGPAGAANRVGCATTGPTGSTDSPDKSTGPAGPAVPAIHAGVMEVNPAPPFPPLPTQMAAPPFPPVSTGPTGAAIAAITPDAGLPAISAVNARDGRIPAVAAVADQQATVLAIRAGLRPISAVEEQRWRDERSTWCDSADTSGSPIRSSGAAGTIQRPILHRGPDRRVRTAAGNAGSISRLGARKRVPCRSQRLHERTVKQRRLRAQGLKLLTVAAEQLRDRRRHLILGRSHQQVVGAATAA